MPEAPPEPFEIAVAEEPGEAQRIVVTGELDLCTAPELRAQLRHTMRTAREVVLDLRGVSFMDSSGLSMIVGVNEESRRDELGFALVPSPQVRRVIELCALQDVLPLRSS